MKKSNYLFCDIPNVEKHAKRAGNTSRRHLFRVEGEVKHVKDIAEKLGVPRLQAHKIVSLARRSRKPLSWERLERVVAEHPELCGESGEL